MDSTPSTPSPEDATARHRALLGELADMGMDMARLLHRQAHAQAHAPEQSPEPSPEHAPTAASPDPFTAFDRIARCVRRTVLLAEHIARPTPARPAATPNDPPNDPAVRRQMLRRIDDLITEYVPPGPRADALHREAAERVDGLDVTEDLRTLSFNQIAAEICRDMQVFGPDTRRRTPADIARALARAAGDPAPEPPTRPETGPPTWVHRSEAKRSGAPPPHATVAMIERLISQG